MVSTAILELRQNTRETPGQRVTENASNRLVMHVGYPLTATHVCVIPVAEHRQDKEVEWQINE